MSTWRDLEIIGEFVRGALDGLRLKKPKPGAAPDNEKGLYELAEVGVYLYALPDSKDPPAPYVRIQPISTKRSTDKITRTLELTIAVWDPGERELDRFDETLQPGVFHQRTEPKSIDRTALGWRDLCAVSDRISEALAKAPALGGMAVIGGESTFAPLADQDGVLDLFPYWGGTLRFDVERKTDTPTVEGL